MKKLRVLFLLLFPIYLYPEPTEPNFEFDPVLIDHARYPHKHKDLDPDANYIRFIPTQENGTYSMPALSAFPNKEFTGSPILELNNQGLLVEGKIACKYTDNGMEKLDPSNLISTKKGSLGCTEHPPVFSDNDEYFPFGLIIYVESPSESGFYETKFKGKSYYIDRSKLNNFKFYTSKNNQFETRRNKENSNFRQLISSDTDLQKFTKDASECFGTKDEKCFKKLGINTEKLLQRYISSYCGEEGCLATHKSDKFEDICPPIENEKNTKRTPKAEELWQKEVIEQKQKAKNLILDHYKDCFKDGEILNLEGKIEATKSRKIKNRVYLYTNKERTLECTITQIMDNEGTLKWLLPAMGE